MEAILRLLSLLMLVLMKLWVSVVFMKLLLRLSELVVVSSSMLKWDVYSNSSMSSLSVCCVLKADVDEALLLLLVMLK